METASPLAQSPSVKTPEEEKNDRLRGEAIANAILVDKMDSLNLSSKGATSDPSAVATATSVSSAADDELSRRMTITQPSNNGVMLPIQSGAA